MRDRRAQTTTIAPGLVRRVRLDEGEHVSESFSSHNRPLRSAASMIPSWVFGVGEALIVGEVFGVLAERVASPGDPSEVPMARPRREGLRSGYGVTLSPAA